MFDRMAVSTAWIVGLLTALEPGAPWSDTYAATAEAIAHAAESDPLFAEEDHGSERTATILVSLAWYESHFKPDARSKDGKTLCLYQVERSSLPDPKKALTDPDMCTKAAMKILHRSFEQCKKRPLEERMALYMSGQCDRGGPESRYRMYLAKKLLKDHPAP